MNNVKVTREQYDGVQALLKTRTAAEINTEHAKNLGKKYWSLDALNYLSVDQMAMLLYNPSKVDVEPSTEDKLRELAANATNVEYYNGVLATAELLGYPRSIFDSVELELPETPEQEQ